MNMTDEQYVAACASLGKLKDSEISKSFVLVINEARRRTLEGLAIERDVNNMVRLQAHAEQLAALIEVLHGQRPTMTI